MNYKVISVEGEVFEAKDLKGAKEYFLAYVKDTKKEFVNMGERTKEEVKKEMNMIKKHIKDEKVFNDYLIDYGFEPLVIEE